MSLNVAQRERTERELRINLLRAAVTEEELAAALGFDALRLARTLAVQAEADPADVWLLRDTLERAVRDRGAEPVPFTVLSEGARRAAAGWYRLRSAPAIPPR